MEPMSPKPFFEGDGGSYHKWLPSDYPLLAQTNVAAGRLLLRPRGFALPHYADSSKVGYVLRGNLSFISIFKLISILGVKLKFSY